MGDLQSNEVKIAVPLWLRAVFQLGFPAGVAIILLFAVLGSLREELREIKYQGWQQTMIMRAICHSLAHTQKDRVSCEPWKAAE